MRAAAAGAGAGAGERADACLAGHIFGSRSMTASITRIQQDVRKFNIHKKTSRNTQDMKRKNK